MTTLTYNNVIVRGAITLDVLINLKMVVKPNCHGILQLTGIISREISFSELESQLAGTEILVMSTSEQDPTPIFDGFIRHVETGEQNDYYFAKIIALSGTCKLDEEKHSRSFQDVKMTYADVVKEVLKDTSGAAAIFSVGLDREIGIPLIQYKETDWEFFKRLASHFSSALIPDCRVGEPWFWFGMREGGDECEFSDLEYHAHVNEKFYKMGAKFAGLRNSSFFYYLVQDTKNQRIGDIATFHNGSFLICSQRAQFMNGEIIFTYQLGQKDLIGEREYYNENFTGLSLEGTVVKTDHEHTWIHLDIDGKRQGVTYPYYWVPTTGNLMYCMPKLGTRASLYIPSHDEREARATNSPRVNGSSCVDMEDYNRRYLTTEHNKRMYWFPEMMGFVGTSGESTPLHIMLDDENYMLMESHKKTQIIAKDEVLLEAPQVSMRTPTELETLRSSKEIDARSALIVPKGTWGGPRSASIGASEYASSTASSDSASVPQGTNQLELPNGKSGCFEGTLRGANVKLDDVKTQPIQYTKRERTDLSQLRNEFNRNVKKQFLQKLSENTEELKAAGFSEDEIDGMKCDGEVSDGWQVHHKIPLDDGGTNDFENLVLIKNEPYHKVITNYQNSFAKTMNIGETKEIEWPIPDGKIYPLRQV